MNKAQLIEQLAKDAGITKVKAGAVLNCLTGTITLTLKKGETVSLMGFGTFSVSQHDARNGRNPQTGEAMKIKARKVAKFKASKDFSERVAAERIIKK